MAKKKESVREEIHDVETYEYLLVKYIKEISNEMTYLMLTVCSLFIYIAMDAVFSSAIENFELVRLVFLVTTVGGFALFGMSNIKKSRIEKKFSKIFQ
jgi:uncharacterized membrane protein